jgi:crotonobetainyl-CoA:carnitine CoA-transferase CaiB-like acyl-CoA transferase
VTQDAPVQPVGPLEGLVVLDLSTTLASAFTTLLFADHGAEVIQVEPPGGSRLRQMAAWPTWLRGKKSVVLDLKDPADLAVARSLAAESDVVVESFGAKVADRLGLGYEDLREANPALVYTSITGFGHDGPYAHLKAHEAVVMAKTGSMYGNIAPHRPGEPVMTTPFGATFSGALLAMQGTLLALHARESTGYGQRVDATMIQGMLAQDPWSYFMKILANRYPDAFTAVGAPTAGRRVPTSWLSFGLLNGYSKDGRWLQFAHAVPKQFEAFLRALGLDDLRQDPEWKDAPDSPDDEMRDRWWSMMLERVRERTVAEWQAVFDADRDVFAEVYLSGLELMDHPQIRHDHHVAEVEVEGLGRVREMGTLVQLKSTPGTAERPVPTVDQHGDELRRRAAPRPAAPAGPEPAPAPPLDGLVVIDLGTFYAGPFASAMLADQGATVIKLESLEGDPIRFQMPVPESAGVRVLQGKKSVAVNLGTAEGRRIATELVARADVVLHTYRGGVAARLGLDAERMHEVNPDLVYHHGVGYGVDGPYAGRAAFAPTIAAGSGFARRSGGGGIEGAELTLDEIKDGTLRLGGAQPGHPDGMAALGAAVGLLLNLYARDRGHGGQASLTSMLSTMGHVLSDSLVDYDGVAAPPVTDPDAYGFSALYRLYRASDAWVVLCAPDERSWDRLVAAMPGARLEDTRFSTAVGRAGHDAELAGSLAAAFARRPAGEWERELSAAGLGCAEVQPMQGGLAMGLFEEGGVCDQLGMLTRVRHPIFDEHVRSTELVRLSRGTATLGAGCQIGEHTDEVLRDVLDYDDAEIARLRAAGVLGG